MAISLDERLWRDGLPANLDAERYVIGGVLLTPQNWDDVAHLAPGDFSLQAHSMIWQALADMRKMGAKIDRVTLTDSLMRRKQLEAVGGITYLISLDDGLPQLFDVSSYARIVQEHARRRRLVVLLTASTSAAMDGTQQLADVEAGVARQLADLGASDPRREAYSIAEIVEQIGVQELIAGRVSGGIIPPFDGMAGILEHWRPAEMTIIAARPGWGKTAFGMQCAIDAARRGHRVLVASKEMSSEALLRRMIAMESRTNRYYWQQAEQAERRALVEAAAALSRLDLHVTERPDLELTDFQRVFSQLSREKPVEFVVIDYLQLFRGGRGESRNQELEVVLRELQTHCLSKKYHLLLLSQLSREAEKEFWEKGRPPSNATMRDTGAAEQAADNIIFAWPDPEEFRRAQADFTRTTWKTNMWVTKQRNGSTGTFPLWFVRHHTRFMEQEEAR